MILLGLQQRVYVSRSQRRRFFGPIVIGGSGMSTSTVLVVYLIPYPLEHYSILNDMFVFPNFAKIRPLE